MGDWSLSSLLGRQDGGVFLVFGIALHCIACTGKMGMTHRPARGNGNPSEGVGEWAPLSLSLSLSFGIWVRSCDKKKGLRVEFWIPELLDDETCIYQLSKCRSLGARMFYRVPSV